MIDIDTLNNILKISRDLRLSREFIKAYDFIKSESLKFSELKSLIWQHKPELWLDINAGICVLTRRKKEDAEFIVKLWQDKEFIYQFHRQVSELDSDIVKVQKKLENEYCSIINESFALHWVIRSKKYIPFGILSLTNLSITNKSAELLIGLKKDAPFGLTIAAMLILFEFYFKFLNFNKLYSYIYDDNHLSLKTAISLGFKQEGVLREHFFDPKTRTYKNVIQVGILKNEFMSVRNKLLMDRLLR